MAIVGVSPTGEPWESPPLPHHEHKAVSVEEEGDDDEEIPSYEEECEVPLLGHLPAG